MFDKLTLHPTQTHYVDRNVTVHQHRAPTDESIRLLKEFESSAFEKLLSAFEVKNNLISGKIIFYQSIDVNKTYFRIILKINGAQHNIEGNIDNYTLILEKADRIIELFFANVSKCIVEFIINDNVATISKDLLKRR